MYWDLCSSVADYNLSLQELDELNRLIALAGGTDRSLSDAVADMRVRVGTSRKAAEANQWRLASAIGRSGPVLPADLLHVGGYDTRYAEIFGSRSSGEAAELNALIPLRHAELLAATQGVLRAEDRLSQVAAGGQASAADIAASMELLALRRRAFVQLAKDYNRRIAHYTELSTPGDAADASIGCDAHQDQRGRRDRLATDRHSPQSLRSAIKQQLESLYVCR